MSNTELTSSGVASFEQGRQDGHHPWAAVKEVFAVTLGNGLEFYDFIVYGFFAVTIGQLFFPTHNPWASLLLSIATFSLGFLMRPLGSVVLGHYADNHGRKAALTLIIGLMGLGTLAVACAPTWDQVGFWGPLVLLVGRLLQGFSAGGEVGASTTYLMEEGAAKQRGFRVSFQMASQGFAMLLGSAVGLSITKLLTHEQVMSWGWRLPFLLGLLIVPVGIYIRRQLDEHYEAPVKKREIPVVELLKNHKREMILGILMIMKITTGVYLVSLFMPTYLTTVLHRSSSVAYELSLTCGILTTFIPPLGGFLADRFGRRKPMLVTLTILSLCMVFPLYLTLNYASQPIFWFMVIIADQVITNLSYAVFFLLLMEVFPRHVRASGLAIVYSFGVTLFGAFAQFNVTWLIAKTGNPLSPAWYLFIAIAVSLVALLMYREGEHESVVMEKNNVTA